MNIMKLLGSLGNLKNLEADMQEMTRELAELKFEGRAAGDMVVVVVNGQTRMISCTIDSRLIDDKEKELIEELVVSATNQAMAAARAEAAKRLQTKVSETFDMPEIGNLIGKFMPGA